MSCFGVCRHRSASPPLPEMLSKILPIWFFVSAAVTWEIEIKIGLGKLRAPSALVNQLAAANFQELPITIAHTLAIKQLPNLHRDPFDRIRLAQAKAAGLTLVTADPQVLQYPGTFLRAM